MRIESGTTTEHRVRLSIFFAMCLVFAGYFGYDGLWGYAAKNLPWARQNILNTNISTEQKERIKTNPKVLLAALEDIQRRVATGEVLTEVNVRGILGEPAAVASQPDGNGTELWYVGPAACGRLRFADGKLQEPPDPKRWAAPEKREGDIWLQKVLGAVLGVLSLGIGIHYIRIMTMKTVLDDAGLTAKGRRVAWDEMTELDTSVYSRKGWLDVVYRRDGDTDTVRLDTYHIARFDEIVTAICERKDFTNPIQPRGTELAEEA